MSAPGGVVGTAWVEILPAMSKFTPSVKAGVEEQSKLAQNQLQAIPRAANGALRQAEQETKRGFGRIRASAKEAFSALGGGAITGLLATAGVIEFGKKSIDTFEGVARQSLALQRVMGGTVKEASEWRGAMQLAGVSSDQFQTSVRKLSGQINAAALGKKSGFDQLGLAVKDAQGHLKPMGELLPQIADKLKAMAPGAQRNAVAVQLFGRAGLQMLPFLLRGSTGMEELRKKADELGITIGDKQAAQFKKSAAAHRELTARIQGLQIWIGERLVPAVDKFLDVMTRYVVPALQKVVMASAPVIRSLAKVVEWVVKNWKAMLPLAGVLATFAAIWVANWIRMQVVATVNAVKMAAAWLIALGPIAWITAAVVAIATLIILNWTKISTWTKRIWGDVWNWLKGLWNTIWKFLKTWGPIALLVLAPFIGIPLIIYQHWNQITHFLGLVWHDIWTFLKTWGPLALAVLVPFIGIPLLIWQHFSAISGFMKRAWDAAVKAIRDGISTAISVVKQLPGKITGALAKADKWLYNIGADAVRGLWKGIQSLGSWIWTQVKKIIPGWIKSALGIKSPPDWAVDLGKWIARGLAKGITHFPHFLAHLADAARKKLAEVAGTAADASIDTLRMLAGAALQPLIQDKTLAQAYALRLVTGPMHWDFSQFASLMALWQGESGWRYNAINPTSGAYGIPQSLPAEKMASAGSDWASNAATQIRWGLAYIKDRYGNPGNAYAQWVSRHPHWYREGAWRIPADQLAYLHRGEMVVPTRPAEKFREAVSRPGQQYTRLHPDDIAAIAVAVAQLRIDLDGHTVGALVTRAQNLQRGKGIRR